nr:Nop14 protein domain containing protein [Haemonchus contortus]
MVGKKRPKEAINKKKSKKVRKVNPFELKFNRLKHDVLGKKKGTVDVGHPGLSRKRAYEQRKKTLGVEYDRIGKANKIVDRRIGEKNKNITSEEKASLRFAAERAKHLKKGSKFNLTDVNEEEDEELLTHGGRALTDIQKYDKTIVSDDDDDGNIGADVVKVAHFGGGELDNSTKTDVKPSRKDVIADLIAKTRQSREEKHIAKDELQTITEDLDAKYHRLLGKVKTVFRPVGATKAEKSDKDDYDKLAISLKIDADSRATPAERTKTVEELAAEERCYLEEMESLRKARMNEETNKKRHHSIDAEGADGKEKKKAKKAGFEVRFGHDGKLLNIDKLEPVTKKKVAIESDDELTDEEDEDHNEEELNELLEEHDDEGLLESAANDTVGENGDASIEEECNRDDSLNNHVEGDEVDNEQDQVDAGKMKNSQQRVELAHGDLDVPFLFEMPKKYDALVELLSKYPAGKIDIVLQRLIKCYHPSLAEGNKKLLSKLFLYLLRYYDDLSNSPLSDDSVKVLGFLTKAMYSVIKFDVEFGVRCVRALIRQKWRKRMNKPKSPTEFSLISLLRLIASLFPVSDRWHPVCTPAMALAAVSLAKCQIRDLTILTHQIMLATVLSDYVEESKRYIPEAIAFCQGALLVAVENEESEHIPSVAFPISMPHRRMLLINKDMSPDSEVKPIEIRKVFAENETCVDDSDLNKCAVLRALIALIQKYRILYAAHEHTFTATFSPFVDLLKRLPTGRMPSLLAEEVEALTRSMEAECMLRSRLTQMSRTVTEKSMLKMLEPRFEDNFDPERPRMGREKKRQGARAEKEKLRHLVKKETRGAIKELRKDAAFLNRKQLKETAAKDKDRKEKTKRLMGGLQSQQGEWNKELWESAYIFPSARATNLLVPNIKYTQTAISEI